MSTDAPVEKSEKSSPLSDVEKTWLCSNLGKQLYLESELETGERKVAFPAPKGVSVGDLLKEDKLAELRELKALTDEEFDTRFGDQAAAARQQLQGDLKTLEALRMPLESLAERAAKLDEKELKRSAKLDEIRNLLAIQKEEFSQRTDVTYNVKRKLGPGSKKIPAKVTKGQFVGMNIAKSDSDEYLEYSAVHYESRTEELDPETKKLLELVISQLKLITTSLLDDEEIDVTPNELMSELWTPLVREGIVSSDQCPTEFSRIMALWKGASGLYKKRCEEKARQEQDSTEGVQNALEDLDQVLDISADVIAIVLSVVGSEDSVKILKLVRTCTHAGLQGSKKLLAQEFDKASSSVSQILEAAFSFAGQENLGKMVAGGFTATVNGALMSKSLANRDFDGAFGFLCDGLGGAFVAIDKGDDDGKSQEIGNHVIAAMKGTKGFGRIVYLLSQPEVDSAAVLKEFGSMTKDGLNYGLQTYKLAKDAEKKKDEAVEKAKSEGKSEAEIKSLEEQLDKDAASLSEDVESLIGTIQDDEEGGIAEGLIGSLGLPTDDELDEEAIMQDILRRTEDKAIKQAAQEQETFEKRIAIAFGVGVGADSEQAGMIEDLYDIDVLIAEIEAAQARLQLFKTLLDAVSGVVTLLIPQLGGPLKARQFAFDCAAAVQRGQELVKFKGLASDARKATSPQAHTLIAQIDELSHQLSNDIMEAAFHMVEACTTTAAAACELSGMAAPAGEALKLAEKGIEALHKAKDFLYTKFKEKKVKRAWQQFRRAIDNPEDRRAIMKAFRKNPTLAKYGMAYGALEMGDAIAKETLRQCGLNDMVLANEKTNADKVVRYLEVKYSDDVQVVGVLSKFAPDSGDPLSLQVWVKNKEAATESGWLAESTTLIDASLQKTKLASDAIEGLKTAIGAAEEAELVSHWVPFQQALIQLAAAFRAYQPKTKEGTPYTRFLQYLDELATAAEEKAAEVNDDIALRRQAIKRQANGLKELLIQIQIAKDSIKAVIDGLTECLPEDSDTTRELAAQKVADFFKSGGGKSANVAIANCKKTSVIMTQDIDVYLKSTVLVVAKTARDPVQVADHINETIRRIRICETRFDELVSAG